MAPRPPDRFLVSFTTTDSLSGIDHYDVGVLNGASPTTESPIFVESESPYQIPFSAVTNGKVIVRAYDKAGNMREATLNIELPKPQQVNFVTIAKNATIPLLIGALIVIVIMLGVEHFIDRSAIHHIEEELAQHPHEHPQASKVTVSTESRPAEPPQEQMPPEQHV